MIHPPEDFDKKFGDNAEFDPATIPWYERWLMKFFPKVFLRMHSAKLKIGKDKIDCAYKLFNDAKRIDINPLSGVGGRGFIITIDNKLSLWFFQDGDHFKFDGIEMGEYDSGDVTVFDGIGR